METNNNMMRAAPWNSQLNSPARTWAGWLIMLLLLSGVRHGSEKTWNQSAAGIDRD